MKKSTLYEFLRSGKYSAMVVLPDNTMKEFPMVKGSTRRVVMGDIIINYSDIDKESIQEDEQEKIGFGTKQGVVIVLTPIIEEEEVKPVKIKKAAKSKKATKKVVEVKKLTKAEKELEKHYGFELKKLKRFYNYFEELRQYEMELEMMGAYLHSKYKVRVKEANILAYDWADGKLDILK